MQQLPCWSRAEFGTANFKHSRQPCDAIKIARGGRSRLLTHNQAVQRRRGHTATASAGTHLSCVCFTVIIDDIVFPDGRTLMQVLGGGGKTVSSNVVQLHGASSSSSSRWCRHAAGGPPFCFLNSAISAQARSRCSAISCTTSSGRASVWRQVSAPPISPSPVRWGRLFDALPKGHECARNMQNVTGLAK